MIVYHLNQQLKQKANNGQLIIVNAKLANDQLTLDVEDTIAKKLIRFIINKPKVSNEDIQLIGAKVKNAKISQYRQIFKTKLFDAYSLDCEMNGQAFQILAN